jgi:enoyl-CoA hydratase/carnithine racemase
MRKQSVNVHIKDGIAMITLNRPENLNILDGSLKYDLLSVLPSLDTDKTVKVLILTGSGKTFCAGGDIRAFKRRYDDFIGREGAGYYYKNTLGAAVLNVSKPIIAAINGAAIGGGFSMSLACDIRIASEKAIFNAGFVRVGLTPELGSSFILPRLVGLGKALELIMTARDITSHEAEKIGLVNKVVPADELSEASYEMARTIAAYPPIAVRLAKKAVLHNLESSIQDSLDYESHLMTYCFTTRDHNEAITAFLNKRKPEFKGI